MTEIWKCLKFTDNKYFISNHGRLRYLNSKPYENKPSKEGYVRFTFKSKPYNVHRLVAELFCEREEGMNIVDHINGLRNDNRAENLRWTNHSGNNSNRVYGRTIVKPEIINSNSLELEIEFLKATINRLEEQVEYYKDMLYKSEETKHTNTMGFLNIINKYQNLLSKTND